MKRRLSKTVRIGKIAIGGENRIAVQSMLCAPSDNIAANVEQAKKLANAGCDIIRVAIPDADAVKLVYALKSAVDLPLIADIHFDWRLAVEAASAGADKIRINPGNIGDDSRVKAVADCCREHGIPIRIGVNSGSVEKHILQKYGSPTAEALVESAMYHVKLLNRYDFDDIVISIKASDVQTMVQANEMMARRSDYPLHIGVTEAGTERMGIIKSSIGIGSLLLHGIGDTIRVSLTADPVKEVYAGFDILKAAGLCKDGVELISCPTCGRTRIDLMGLAAKVEESLRGYNKPLKVAVMGCAVNGPGEAREADIGIAGGNGDGILFKKGKILRKVPEDRLLEELIGEIRKMDAED